MGYAFSTLVIATGTALKAAEAVMGKYDALAFGLICLCVVVALVIVFHIKVLKPDQDSRVKIAADMATASAAHVQSAAAMERTSAVLENVMKQFSQQLSTDNDQLKRGEAVVTRMDNVVSRLELSLGKVDVEVARLERIKTLDG